jgi:isopenicillin N synthase-like dioxygenase
MKKIPVIDMSPAIHGDTKGEEKVAHQIDKACREFGFFIVKGHGYGHEIFAEAMRLSKVFFNLPLIEKNKYRADSGATLPEDPYTPYGYSALLEENTFAYMGVKDKPSDYVEKISVGQLIMQDGFPLPLPVDNDGVLLRNALKAYFQTCEDLSKKILELLTVALGWPRTFFDDKINQSNDSLRSQFYPKFSEDFDNKQGMAKHKDGTLITMVCQTAPGIMVKNLDGGWMLPDTEDVDHVLINIGDLMSYWTEKIYLSTEHQVVLGKQERQSIIYFKLTNEDFMVEFGNQQMDALLGRSEASSD